MGGCSLPEFAGLKRWFDDRFADICHAHDLSYKTLNPIRKAVADFKFCATMGSRGYAALACASFVLFMTLGWLYWAYRRYRDYVRKS